MYLKSKAYAKLFAVSVAVSAILVLASALLTEWSWRLRSSANDWVEHTYLVRLKITEVSSAILDVQKAAEDYVLAQAGKRGSRFDQISGKAMARIAELKALTSDNPIQQPRCDQLSALAAQQIKISRVMMDHERGGQHDFVVAMLKADASIGTKNQIGALLVTMDSEEVALLKARKIALVQACSWQNTILWAIIATQVLFGAVAALLARKVARLDRLVTVCAWSKKLRYRGEWISLESYLENEHGILASHGVSPEEYTKLMAHLET